MSEMLDKWECFKNIKKIGVVIKKIGGLRCSNGKSQGVLLLKMYLSKRLSMSSIMLQS